MNICTRKEGKQKTKYIASLKVNYSNYCVFAEIDVDVHCSDR